MALMTMAFWLRALAIAVATGIASLIVAFAGPVGPCGFTHAWQWIGLEVFVSCAMVAKVATAILASMAACRLAGRLLVRR